jgi:hypothetical protein
MKESTLIESDSVGGARGLEAIKPQSGNELDFTVLASLLTILVAVCAVLALWNPYDVESSQINWSMAVGLIGSIPLIWRLSAWKISVYPVFEFHLFFFAIAFGFTGVCPYYLMRVDASDEAIWWSRFYFFLYFGSSLLTFHLVSKINIFRRTQEVQCGWIPDVWLVAVSGVVLLAVNQLQLAPGFLGQVTKAVEFLLLALGMWYFCNRSSAWGTKLAAGGYLGLAAIAALLSGFLAQLILLGAAFCCAWIFFSGRTKAGQRLLLPMSAFGLGLLGLIAVNPMKTSYRLNASTNSNMVVSDKFMAVKDAYNSLPVEFMSADYIRESVEQICSRFSMVPVMAAVVLLSPDQIPFKNGATILPIFVKWIPRAVWADKPTETIGNDWGREYGLLDESDLTTSQNLPLIVEGYLNRGASGILAMGIFVGLAFQSLVQLFERRAITATQKVALLACLMPLFYAESNFSNTFGLVLISLVVILGVLKLTGNRM